MSLIRTIADLEHRVRIELARANLTAVSRAVGIHHQHLRKFRDGTAGLSPENLDRVAQHLGFQVVARISKKSA